MSTRPRNEDLPILAELGDDLVAGFRRQERAEAARRNRRRLRRLAAATAALFVVVPGAVATRYIWAPDPSVPAKGAFVRHRSIQIADGRGDVVSWRLSAAVTGKDGLCWQLHLFTAGEDYGRGSACDGATSGQPLGMNLMAAGGESFVFGWLDRGVARVVVDPGNGDPAEAARIVVAPRDRVEKAGLPAGARAYVASSAADLAERSDRVVAVAFDASGREVGRIPPR